MRSAVQVMINVDQLLRYFVLALQYVDGRRQTVGLLEQVVRAGFLKLHELFLGGALQAEQKWYRGVVDRCSVWTSYTLHPRNSRNLENCLCYFIQYQKICRIAQIVIGLDHQNIRHQSRLRKMTLSGCISHIGWNVLGHVEPVVVARLITW